MAKYLSGIGEKGVKGGRDKKIIIEFQSNRLVFTIKFWTDLVMIVFKYEYTSFSLFKPNSIISSLSVLFIVLNLGI